MAEAHPLAKVKMATVPGPAVSAATSAVSTAATSVWADSARSRIVLRDRRSARAPPTGPMTAMGTNAAAAITADHTARRVWSAT